MDFSSHGLFAFGQALAGGPVLLLSVQGFLHLCVVIQSLSHRVDNVLLQIQRETLLLTCPPPHFPENLRFYPCYLQAGEEVSQLNEERQEDESDEARLRRRFGHFIPVHEGRDGETL